VEDLCWLCRIEADGRISGTLVSPWGLQGQNGCVVINRSCRLQKFGLGVVVVLAGLLASTQAKAVSSVSLQWLPNTDPSVVGYNVYYGGGSRQYTNVFSAGNTTTSVIDGLVEGQTYYFAVTAYDEFGDESDYSDETVYIVPGYLKMTPGINPGDPFQIQFPVAPEHWYELQASVNLTDWNTIWQALGVSNTWVKFDVPVTDATAQFFRVILH
jgi:hypothetical protein